jgi:hypothetical protein
VSDTALEGNGGIALRVGDGFGGKGPKNMRFMVIV